MRRKIPDLQSPTNSNKDIPSEKQPDGTRFELFAGKPAWITHELLDETLKTWQPYYKEKLSPQDAFEILQNMGRMFDILN